MRPVVGWPNWWNAYFFFDWRWEQLKKVAKMLRREGSSFERWARCEADLPKSALGIQKPGSVTFSIRCKT